MQKSAFQNKLSSMLFLLIKDGQTDKERSVKNIGGSGSEFFGFGFDFGD